MIAIINATAFSCDQTDEVINSNPEQISSFESRELSSVEKDLVIDELAKVVSISIKDVDVRKMLHDEISKQFDFDYDILYSLIKDKVVETSKYGEQTFEQLLLDIARDNNISVSNFEKNASLFKNMQISSPIYCDVWNVEQEIPQTISLPVDYNENLNTAVASYRGSKKSLVYEKDIDEPIILIRQSERVNAEGMMRIDPTGIVIPEYMQVLTAKKAYEIAASGLKSALVSEPFIEIFDDETFEAETNQRIKELDRKFKPVMNSNDAAVIYDDYTIPLKSASATSLPIPTITAVYPHSKYQIKIDWNGMTGADKFEVFRQSGSSSNARIAILSGTQSSYVDTDDNWVTGKRYFYSIRAVDKNGDATGLTAPYEAIRSWRSRGSADRIHKIYISKKCWNWCCGLFDGRIELEYKTAHYDKSWSGAVLFPSSGTNSFGQQTIAAQKDKWCVYNKYLFGWDPKNMSYNYKFKMIEDDGDGNGTKVTLGINWSVVIAEVIELKENPVKIEFTIANSDDQFNELEVNYGEKGVGCKKGNAKIYIAQ